MKIQTLVLSLFVAVPVAAQDLDLAEVQRDLDHVFERPPGRVDPAVVKERFAAFWKKYEGKELGRLSFARGLSQYWNRDVAAAVKSFDGYLAKYDPTKIASREQRMTIGRAYLSTAVRMSREKGFDVDAYVSAARNFARCYADMAGVAGIVTRYLGKDQQVARSRARVAMAQEVVRKKLGVAETDRVLAAIYGSAPAGARAGRRAAAPRARPKQPTTIKPFVETAMSGREIDLKSYRGQVVLIDFWATWCGPCLREMPHVVAAQKKYGKRGFTVIGISLDKPDAEAKIGEVGKRFGMTWEQIYDGGFWSAKLAKANGIRSIPAAFLIDRKGEVRFSGRDTRGENLARNIEKLLSEK